MSRSVQFTVGAALADILDEYGHALDEAVREEVRDVAKEAVQQLRNTSPKRTGAYAKGWTYRQEKDGSAVVYNKDRANLTHLLEYGHAKPGGRVNGITHIAPVEEWANREFEDRIRQDIERGLI